MQGSTAEPGISGRALGDIFMQKLRREAGGLQRVTVSVSMIEVYNEAFRVRSENNSHPLCDLTAAWLYRTCFTRTK